MDYKSLHESQVQQWVDKHNLEDVWETLKAQGFTTLAVIKTLTDDDIAHFPSLKVGQCRKLKLGVKELQDSDGNNATNDRQDGESNKRKVVDDSEFNNIEMKKQKTEEANDTSKKSLRSSNGVTGAFVSNGKKMTGFAWDDDKLYYFVIDGKNYFEELLT